MSDWQWVYHDPVFECDPYNPVLLENSPWVGHRRFAYDYVAAIRPKTIVELGSYYGCSSFAFLQAMKDHAPDSVFYAVDTWAGDSFTATDYQEDIYGAYRQINEACFGMLQSRMVRTTFDEACGGFAPGSIDLLHIDGSHRYEDVKHDYETWREKVAPDGVIFFHDVGRDLLFGQPMGSHIFWEELKSAEPYTLEFPFSNGLGILCTTKEMHEALCCVVEAGPYQMEINLRDTVRKDQLRKAMFDRRGQETYLEDLQNQLAVVREHLSRYENDVEAKSAYIGALEQRLAEESAAARAEGDTLRREQQALAQFAQGKAAYAADLEGQKTELLAFLEAKENYIQELEQQMQQLREYAGGKERYIGELLLEREELGRFIAGKEAYIGELESGMTWYQEQNDTLSRHAAEQERQHASLTELLRGGILGRRFLEKWKETKER